MSLLSVPTMELLKLWGELVEAFHGVNGFGGHVAEIYAYRFNRDDPRRRDSAHGSDLHREAEREAWHEARELLHDLLSTFERVMHADCEVDGVNRWDWWQNSDGFGHRVHVKVTPRKDGQ